MEISNKKVWVLDTEDDSEGHIYQINFYDGTRHYWFDTEDAAFKFLTEYGGQRVIVFAVNLEYDILNTFRGFYAKIRWRFGRSRLISCRYKRFVFYDTLSHWKMSVAEMGKHVGSRKLPFNPKSKRYCQRDCEVTFKFVKEMVTIYKRIGFTMKSTLPATVYDFWRRTYNTIPVKPMATPLLDRWRLAYYGGRVDCFFIGTWKGAVRVIDVNSLYPAVMRQAFPNPYLYEDGFNLNGHGITHCQVEVEQQIPVLPFRTEEGKLIYPKGRFSGWWVNEELRYAVELGGVKIRRVYDSYSFPITSYPFAEFVEDFYRRRQAATGDLWRTTYKLSMNSLYGKFGQGKETTNVMSLSEYRKKKPKLGTDQIAVYDDLVIYQTAEKYPINTNMIWAALTTAYGRIALHRAIADVTTRGGFVLYCDTDSIFYATRDGGEALLPTSTTLGAWKDEGTYAEATIRLPKLYQLRGPRTVTKVKGVPKSKQEEFFETRDVSFKKPVKFKESLRRSLVPNLWITTSKTDRRAYDKGTVGRDGRVLPFVLREKK